MVNETFEFILLDARHSLEDFVWGGARGRVTRTVPSL